MPTLSWFPMPVYVDKVLGEAKEKIEEELYDVYNSTTWKILSSIHKRILKFRQ